MYSILYGCLRKYAWPGGKDIRRILHRLDQSQWFSRTDLQLLQLKKIQQLLSYAYEHVPFYRRHYSKLGIHPSDIKTLKDFQAIPFLTRDHINNNLDSLVSKVYEGKIYMDKTGGSTGHPMRFYMDLSSARWSAAVETRSRGWYGVKLGDKRAWVWGNQKDFPNWHWKQRAAANLKRYRYLNAHTMQQKEMGEFARMLVKWKPAMFRAYPSALSIFARFIEEEGITGISPKLIETSAEKVTPDQRRLFKSVFGAQVADHYSSWEIYDIAYECPDGRLHVCEDRYLELVKNDDVVDDDQMGEVVITSLTQNAMPFIRYKNGDLALYESEECSCGRGLPVLKEVVGRNSDLLSLPDGRFVSGTVAHYLTKVRPEIAQFRVYQPDREHLEFLLVCKDEVDSAWIEELLDDARNFFGDDMHISIKFLETIPLTPAGKHRFVISDVKPNFS